MHLGFPGSSDGKESACNVGDPCSIWVGKIPWRRKWQPTPVFLPRKSHGQRSLAGYGPRGCKQSGTTERLTLSKLHLPLQGLNQLLLQLLTFSHLLKEVQGGEQTWDTLCSGQKNKTKQKKTWQERSSNRYSQEPILWAQLLHLLIARQAMKRFLVMSAPRD